MPVKELSFEDPNPQNGVILIVVLLLLTFFIALGGVLLDYGATHLQDARHVESLDNSLLAAEAGAESTLFELNKDASYSPPGGETQFYSTQFKGKATYQVQLANGTAPNEKVVTSTGRIYFPQSSTSPTAIRKVKVYVTVSPADYIYSVQTGPGGLIMSNSAAIANGKVRVNGALSMKDSSHIGTNLKPLEIWVSDYDCPVGGGATFPVLCDSSHQAITNLNSSHIYASVHKHNQVNSSAITGTTDEVDADPISLPDDHRSTIKSGIINTGTSMTAAAASCSSGTRTWGNVHITGGDVTVSNSCVVTVTGDVWIDGGLTIKNSSQIKVAAGLVNAPTIMADGSTGFASKDSSVLASNSGGVAFKIIAFYCGSGCSPDTGATATQLFANKDVVTVSMNNSSGAAGSILYSRWGRAAMLNSSSIGGLIGQSVQFSNSSSITFGAQLGGGNQTIFSVKFYQEIYN